MAINFNSKLHSRQESAQKVQSQNNIRYTSGVDSVILSNQETNLITQLLNRIQVLELRLDTQQSSFERIQNLVYDKVPTFESRITQLQNQISQLLFEPSTVRENIIRLQTTPRYESTLAMSMKESKRQNHQMARRTRKETVKSKLSTPDPEDFTTEVLGLTGP